MMLPTGWCSQAVVGICLTHGKLFSCWVTETYFKFFLILFLIICS